MRNTFLRLKPRTYRGRGTPNWHQNGFLRIARVTRGGPPQNLQYPRVHQFDTYSRKLQVDTVSGHQIITPYVRLCSAKVGIFCDMSHMGELSCFPAYNTCKFIGVYGTFLLTYAKFKICPIFIQLWRNPFYGQMYDMDFHMPNIWL